MRVRTGQITHPFTAEKVAHLGHDIAENLYNCGVDVTMVQRSSTLVISSEKGVPILLSAYTEDGPATEVWSWQNVPWTLMINGRVCHGKMHGRRNPISL